MKTALTYIVFLTLLFAACKQKSPGQPPNDKEVYNFFLDQMKQTAKASGYQSYKLEVGKIHKEASSQCATQDGEMVTCFGITIDRTEYYDNYTGTYVTKITNDVFRLYRDEYGKLAVASHIPGQTETEQKHRSWERDAL